MPTVTATFTFDSTTQGFAFIETDAASGSAQAYYQQSATGGNPGGQIVAGQSGGATAVMTGYWAIATTWESLGVPSGATVTAVQLSADETAQSSDSAPQAGPYTLVDGSGATQATLLGSQTFATGTTAWATRSGSSQSVPSGIQAAGSSVGVRVAVQVGVGSPVYLFGGSVGLDNVTLAITYTAATGTVATAEAGATASASPSLSGGLAAHDYAGAAASAAPGTPPPMGEALDAGATLSASPSLSAADSAAGTAGGSAAAASGSSLAGTAQTTAGADSPAGASLSAAGAASPSAGGTAAPAPHLEGAGYATAPPSGGATFTASPTLTASPAVGAMAGGSASAAPGLPSGATATADAGTTAAASPGQTGKESAAADAGATLSASPTLIPAFDPAGALDVRAVAERGELLVAWTAAAGASWFQVYVGGSLAYDGPAARCLLPLPAGATRVDVGSIAPAHSGMDFSSSLPRGGLPSHATLTWTGGTAESPTLAGFRVYGGGSPGAAVDYGTVLATVAAYPGVASSSYTWSSGPLSPGTWHFGVEAYDAAGNASTAREVAVAIAGPPAECPAFATTTRAGDSPRLHLSYVKATGVATLSWNPSPG